MRSLAKHKDKSCGLSVRSKEAARVLGFGAARRVIVKMEGQSACDCALMFHTQLSSDRAFEDEG